VSIPALPKPLAKRIDGLAWRAHAFHRFAHHPLCDSYRGEVLRLGRRIRLCKGCTLLALGFLAGIVLGGLWQPPPLAGVAAWALALVIGVSSLRARLPKIIGRLIPGVGLGVSLWAGFTCVLLALASVGICTLLYRRRGMERSRCGPCHERDRKPCPGFVLIVRRERAFQRKAACLIDRHRRGLGA
jgi:hypothetical protein